MSTPASEARSINGICKPYSITVSLTGKLGQEKYRNRFQIQDDLYKTFKEVVEKVGAVNSDFTFEVADKSTKVHLHGIFSTPLQFTYRSLQVFGYYIYTRELRNEMEEQNWFTYINKDQYLFMDD